MRKGMLFNKKEYSKFTTMKRMLLAFFLLPSFLFSLTASAQGIPFIRNYTSDEYHANNTNFDIETDEYGNVFAANFEGLMYYDFAHCSLQGIRQHHLGGRIQLLRKDHKETKW